MSVGAYAALAHDAIDELVGRHGAAVVCGGTGLYLRAALADLAVPPPPEPGARERIRAEVELDPAAAHGRLSALDPRAAGVVHANDTRRLVRALELAEQGESLVPDDDRLWASATRHPTLVAGLDVPADELERRIVARTDAMFARGRRRGGAGGTRWRDLAHGGEGTGAGGDRIPAGARGPRADHRAHTPLRGVPAQVDAPHPRPR